MTAFALGMGVAASIVKVPAIVGIFVAGMCFGGSDACRISWDRNTRNLTHWLSRIFFTCSIGFIMPESMAMTEAVLDGFEVADVPAMLQDPSLFGSRCVMPFDVANVSALLRRSFSRSSCCSSVRPVQAPQE